MPRPKFFKDPRRDGDIKEMWRDIGDLKKAIGDVSSVLEEGQAVTNRNAEVVNINAQLMDDTFVEYDETIAKFEGITHNHSLELADMKKSLVKAIVTIASLAEVVSDMTERLDIFMVEEKGLSSEVFVPRKRKKRSDRRSFQFRVNPDCPIHGNHQ